MEKDYEKKFNELVNQLEGLREDLESEMFKNVINKKGGENDLSYLMMRDIIDVLLDMKRQFDEREKGQFNRIKVSLIGYQYDHLGITPEVATMVTDDKVLEELSEGYTSGYTGEKARCVAKLNII